MKILSAAQIYQADQATIKNTPISSTDLMEKAAYKCYQWLVDHFEDQTQVFHIFCGMGNNGGDGLVMSRYLIEKGYKVHTYLICFTDKRSDDFKLNLERLHQKNASVIEIRKADDFPLILKEDIAIDAIFGIGLKRAPEGLSKRIIQQLNESQVPIISIDIPSGLFASSPVTDHEAVIHSAVTLSFQVPKLAFFQSSNRNYLKKWEIIDIELDRTFLEEVKSKYHLIDINQVMRIVKERERFSHKGTFGHSLLIGGSFGKIGAVILASKAALKSGSGLVTAYIPKCGYTAMQSSNPEVMVEVDDEKYLQFFNVKTLPDAIGIGPGLGRHSKTKKGYVKFLMHCKVPLVIDADGLNIISEYDDLLQIIPNNAVLTPHPKEFERLVGPWKNDYEKLEKLEELSTTLKCVIVLKGAYTAIANSGRIYFNQTGNPGLASAGSGDVLTGIITGLLAQGYSSLDASLLGVYLHGRTADIGINFDESVESFSASDCIKYLGMSFKELY